MASNQIEDRAYGALADAQLLLDRLVETAEGADERTWTVDIQHSAERLYDVLIEHSTEAEDQGGIIAAVTEEKPALIPESEQLIDEHAEMIRRSLDLAREAEMQAAFDDFDVDMIRMKAELLRDMVRMHLHRSGILTYEAYFRVEGGEGG